jgi:hypothetical protein
MDDPRNIRNVIWPSRPPLPVYLDEYVNLRLDKRSMSAALGVSRYIDESAVKFSSFCRIAGAMGESDKLVITVRR